MTKRILKQNNNILSQYLTIPVNTSCFKTFVITDYKYYGCSKNNMDF